MGLHGRTTTWREEISVEMTTHDESWDDVEDYVTSVPNGLDKDFMCSYGGPNGQPFTLWTKSRVYFPTQYDGLDGVSSVARNPDGKVTGHV